MNRKTPRVLLLFLAFFLIAGFALAAYLDDSQQAYSPLDKAAYLTSNDVSWVRPGLNVTILGASVGADRKVTVTYKLTDDSGLPLDREGKVTPGAVSMSFIFASIPQGALQHVAYTTRTQTSPITGKSAVQAGTDATATGKFVSLGDGAYTYTSSITLPSNYDTTATHTVGIYATRNLRTFGLSLYMSNVVWNWVPNGAAVTKVRDVVGTKSCNACHDPLTAHGETGRKDVQVCILCHTPQTVDPDTGNTVDMKVMTHKIHMGENLPSVKAGTPYQIIGNAQVVQDYSTVAFPMDIRNCTACHKDTTQVNNWLLNPTAATCGSCHDSINWRSGANHAGGPQPDDTMCARCHYPDSPYEYDSSVKNAHIPEYKSKQLVYPKLQITSVTSTQPGQKPMITFKVTSGADGSIINPNNMARLSFTLAGPTTDYKSYLTENALGKATFNAGTGTATYTFTAAIPATATGTYVMEAESYINTTINPGTTKAVTVRDVSDNVVQPFAVTGTVTPRRQVVSIDKCNACHDKLQPHGSNRNKTDACAVCHIPSMTDTGSRPATAAPAEAIDFKILVHKIHTGEELTNGYTVYGRGGAVDFSEVRYPGDRRDCLQCHVGSSTSVTAFTLPLAKGIGASTTPRGFWDPTMPTAAACLGCHDTIEAAAHALLNTTVIGKTNVESCTVCHDQNAEFSVTAAHAR
jgi:OmcA/MtrC family decaheme c-type cytochrome